MSQHDMNIANQGFPAFRADLNNALGALATTSAGATEPSTTFANQFWYDSTANLLKMRNTDNDAWITLAYFDQTNDEWEVRSAVIQAVDAAGVVIKTDDGTTRIEVQDDGDVSIDSGTLFVDATNNRVGVNNTSPSKALDVRDTSATGTTTGSNRVGLFATSGTGKDAHITFSNLVDNPASVGNLAGNLYFDTNGTERMRIDSSGSVMFGTTDNNPADNSAGNSSDNGICINRNDEGTYRQARYNSNLMYLNRTGGDGNIISFYRDASIVGSIGAFNGDIYIDGQGGQVRIYVNGAVKYDFDSDQFYPTTDNARDLGTGTFRWDDVYATNGTIQTSDRNEKQDIEELSEAEQRVAVAAKALMRKFRWKDAVAEKGDDARIHFGIIAQDLQAAFEAEGLDAGRYAMFISSTWWEHEVEVPAVEAQDAVYETVTIPAEYDEDGNEITPETTEERLVSEAVEAKEAYTRTDTYETAEEAPEGAVERTRLGVRYPELLAFIISAI